MSEDPEKSKSEATSYTAELEINWEYYGYFQNVTDVNYQLEIKRMNEKIDGSGTNNITNYLINQISKYDKKSNL